MQCDSNPVPQVGHCSLQYNAFSSHVRKRGSKPVVWLHGIVEEDPLVGFREQQMRLIEEHFTVVTHRELGETGAAHPGIQGASFSL